MWIEGGGHMLHGFARLHCQLKSAKVFLITVFCISFYLCKNGAVCHHWFTNKTNILLHWLFSCAHPHHHGGRRVSFPIPAHLFKSGEFREGDIPGSFVICGLTFSPLPKFEMILAACLFRNLQLLPLRRSSRPLASKPFFQALGHSQEF